MDRDYLRNSKRGRAGKQETMLTSGTIETKFHDTKRSKSKTINVLTKKKNKYKQKVLALKQHAIA